MNQVIQDDLYRYDGEKSKKFVTRWRYILFTPGCQYIYCFRHVQLASNLLSKLFWNLLLKLCSFKFSIQIPPHTKIDKGFRIVHFGTIVVNPGTIIGKNFNISQGCLIGNAAGKRQGTPIIGDNVCMNANSVIIGGGNYW
jgi:serine O-acetyltransferase